MIVNETGDQIEVLSPKSQNRSINKLFNKLLSRSFTAKKKAQNPSYIDYSITKQREFLSKKAEKSFPNYQISPRPKPRSQKSKCLLIPQLKYTHFKIKDSFNFKKLEALKKNPTISTKLSHRPKPVSCGESINLLSLLRQGQKSTKSSKMKINIVSKNLTIQPFFPKSP